MVAPYTHPLTLGGLCVPSSTLSFLSLCAVTAPSLLGASARSSRTKELRRGVRATPQLHNTERGEGMGGEVMGGGCGGSFTVVDQ